MESVTASQLTKATFIHTQDKTRGIKMKKSGLDLQESTDINIDGCHILKAVHEEDYTIEAAHDEALVMHYEPTRMPIDIARVDYQEMLSFRSMPESDSWDAYDDEEARKAN